MPDLFQLLRHLHLPPRDHVIFGSGPLVIRGIVDPTNDLDVLCRGKAWEVVCRLAPPQLAEPWGVELVRLHDDRLTFGKSWAIGEVDVHELIDTAEWIEGLPFARLEHVVAYKRLAGRPKDLAHLEALEGWRRANAAAGEGTG